ncbi:MAG: preprotein translocase subunit SecA [Candidatus Terrybacteria bacterium RIFCSPLOWO2_01_FULL_48_14]|nr:MAG: preprotein translocase subunit SecA [Candidatus Terrybacteria bacterium RIFCSPLOWO2_01_FULL_48_14]
MFKLFGDANAREIKRLEPLILRINEKEPEIQKLPVKALRGMTELFRKRLEEGETLDDLLPEAFACVREAARRTLGQRHFDVQLIGGVVLHQGKIIEMRTGEGKTLAATAPAYLNALTGRGVHVVTVNDYLARRDTIWMGQIYHTLGMTAGCVTQAGAFVYDPEHKHHNAGEGAGDGGQKGEDEHITDEHDKERDTVGAFKVLEDFLRPVSKKEAYACDITYGTNNEFGFDYLRDNMALREEDMAQRLGRTGPGRTGPGRAGPGRAGGHYFAIVDEVDSILIDEARTPLIISAPDAESPKLYEVFARIAPKLKEEVDYTIDEKRKAVMVTEEGVAKVEKIMGVENLYEEGLRMVHYLEQSLRAKVFYIRDKEYVVRDGEVIIVDEFTGRLMPGRRWSEGLHQAVEAKEGVRVQAESRTLASVTFQNYFRLYEKLSGMTGTAATSAEEFAKVYNLEVVIVPTNKTMVRSDHSDFVFRSSAGKWKAVVQTIKELHDRGQPVLVGTTSIEKNEKLSALLAREGIAHEVLNAKNHEKEGEIIAQAGRLGAVTVATNMAGRGVDVILGGNPPDLMAATKIRELGGLFVAGTERHEARRIDNQLRGRSGRQGDPGASRFFLSLEDDLLRVFGGGMVTKLMETLKVPEDQPIESGLISKSIEQAQSRIEGYNFDARKHLLEYDDVMNKHREAVYKRRREVLSMNEPLALLYEWLEDEVDAILSVHAAVDYVAEWNLPEVAATLRVIVAEAANVEEKLIALCDTAGEKIEIGELRGRLKEWCITFLKDSLAKQLDAVAEDQRQELARQVTLRTIDLLWMEHLETMEALRDAVRLRAYGQKDPLVEYKNDASRYFRQLDQTMRSTAVRMLFKAHISRTHADSTRTYAENLPAHADSQRQSASSQRKSAAEKVGRNDPCPCGSGKKYKKCGLVNAPHHKST